MRFFKLALIVFVLALPLVASAEKKAKTIDELAKMYDSSSCKGCHSEIYSQWEKSHHARPLMGIKDAIFLFPVVKSSAFAPKDPKQATMKNFPCFKCHLPHALDAEDSVAAEIAQAILADDKAKIGKLQITCTVCHNKVAIIHRLQDGAPEKNVIYSKKDVAAHPDKTFSTVKKSAIYDKSIMCGQCHGLGPNFDAENPYQCATLYGSYLHSYVPAGGTQRCQDCHMEKGNHLIAPNWNDRPLASERLKKAVSLDVQFLGYSFLPKKDAPVPMVVVNTKIGTNSGHRIPDG